MGEVDWKRQVLADFERWLETLPEETPEETDAQVCDLYTLFSELAALRQEVRLQSRGQARAVRGMEQAAEACGAAAALFRSGSEGLEGLEARVRGEAERRCVLLFLDVRDALERGLTAAVKLAGRRGVFRRPPAGIAGVVEGYRMALDRFDRALALLGVERISTVGRRFDPRTMRAVEVRRTPGADEEEVLAESRSGFLREEEVLRPAEVVVNRKCV